MGGTDDSTKQLVITAYSKTPNFNGPVPQQGKSWGQNQTITIPTMFAETNETTATLSYSVMWTSGNPQEAPSGTFSTIETDILQFTPNDAVLYNSTTQGSYSEGFKQGTLYVSGGTGAFEGATGRGIIKADPTAQYPDQLTSTFMVNVKSENYERAIQLVYGITMD